MLLCEGIAEQKVLLGSQLSEEQEKNLLRFLFINKDVFAWSANDLCCNAPNFAVEFFLFFTRQNSGVTFSFSFSLR
jgi:hypothetical protein